VNERTRKPAVCGPSDKIVLVSDCPALRVGLEAIVASVSKGLPCCTRHPDEVAGNCLVRCLPKYFVLDASGHVGSVLDLVKQIRARSGRSRILILSREDDALLAQRFIRAGASGFALLNYTPDGLAGSVRDWLDGKLPVSDVARASLLQGGAVRRPPGRTAVNELLSDREVQIFELIGVGLGAKEIAGRLHISVKTVDSHRERLATGR
jgi:DNA-binding NarL/FixJ family response regulator